MDGSIRRFAALLVAYFLCSCGGNDVEIGTTTSAALFDQNLSADIHDSFGVSGGNNSNTATE
jgi:hypothetical protein